MKNVLSGVLSAALLLGAATAAQAQISIGARVGANFSDQGYRSENINVPNVQMRVGGQAGVVANLALGGNLALQPALLYSQKGYRVDLESTTNNITTTYEERVRLNYLELPVNVVYTSDETEGVQVFAGPYVGYGLGGAYSSKLTVSSGPNSGSTERKGDVEYASQEGTDNTKEYVRRLDAGVNFGVGYKTGPIQAQLGYGLGVANLLPNDRNNQEPENKTLNRNLQLSLTYFFGE